MNLTVLLVDTNHGQELQSHVSLISIVELITVEQTIAELTTAELIIVEQTTADQTTAEQTIVNHIQFALQEFIATKSSNFIVLKRKAFMYLKAFFVVYNFIITIHTLPIY